MPTRSAVLGVGVAPVAALAVLGTVPANQTWIVKHIELLNISGAPNPVYVQSYDPATGAVTYLASPILGAGAAYHADLWNVLAPGHVLQIYTASATVQFWISGTKLPGVAP